MLSAKNYENRLSYLKNENGVRGKERTLAISAENARTRPFVDGVLRLQSRVVEVGTRPK